MIDCLNVARYFIVRAYEDGIEAEMTNMKVQKLLYYAQSLHLALYDEPLFDEVIQAWRYGPVCPPAYRFYSDFEANQLPIPSKEFLLEIPDKEEELLEELVNTDDCVIKLVWIYSHEQFAKLPADRDLKSVIKEILDC
jgi:uncharacterized phage-associated protein